MTTFEDGPAAGKRLMLHRAARFLRVCVDSKGEIDALDQPTDTPRPDETLHAYEIVEKPGHMHLNTGRKPGGGFYPIAKYRLVKNHVRNLPTDEEMRSRGKWSSWCEANAYPRPELE